MKYVQHEGEHLRFITVEPNGYHPGASYPMVILLHGFGSHMGDLAGLAPAIDARGYVYAFPNAPIAMNMGVNGQNFAWAPLGGEGTAEALSHADRLVAGFIDEVTAMYDPPDGQIVLGGFSQGGMMAYRSGLSRPGTFAGIAALSSLLGDGRDIEAALPGTRDQAIFACHGTEDTMIPVAIARRDMDFLRSHGYVPEYREYSMAHEVSLDVVSDLATWLHGVVRPLASPR